MYKVVTNYSNEEDVVRWTNLYEEAIEHARASRGKVYEENTKPIYIVNGEVSPISERWLLIKDFSK